MSADLRGGHGHPVAVPEPRVWMTTMTEPKAAQAVATMCGPRQKAKAIGRAVIASSTALERAAGRLTWRKKVMVWAFESSAYGASTKDRRSRRDRIHSTAQKLDWCGVAHARAFSVCCNTDTLLASSRPRVSRSGGSWIHFSQIRGPLSGQAWFHVGRLILVGPRRVRVSSLQQRAVGRRSHPVELRVKIQN